MFLAVLPFLKWTERLMQMGKEIQAWIQAGN